jgi:hypothetical protein
VRGQASIFRMGRGKMFGETPAIANAPAEDRFPTGMRVAAFCPLPGGRPARSDRATCRALDEGAELPIQHRGHRSLRSP